jgi:hypothetical protein
MGIDTSRRAADLLWEAIDKAQESHKWLANEPDPSHEQFYRFGGALSALSMYAASLTKQLSQQVAEYPRRYVLTDDSGCLPSSRICIAVEDLERLEAALSEAARLAGTFQAEIGHIAVQEGENGEPHHRR